jgi:outer membrane lipoprotein-sorting protein
MRYYILIISMLISGLAFAQNDKKAEELLKEIIDKTASYENFKAELSYTMVNIEMDIDEKKTGAIYVQGNSYRIEMEGQIIISDGETVWTYLEDSEEVMISNVEDSDENISPTKILTTYDREYKAKFDNDKDLNDAQLKVINLKPNEGKQFEKMSITANEAKKSLESFSVYDKNGNVFTYTILKLSPNLDLPEGTFVFDSKQYPDVEVIDMR